MQVTTFMPKHPASGDGERSKGRFLLALLLGLLPLALLVVVIGGTLTVLAVIRPIIAATSFFEQQYLLASIALAGLTLATIGYIFVCKHMLKRIRSWHLAGHKTSVNTGLWALLITSMAVMLPVCFGFFGR